MNFILLKALTTAKYFEINSIAEIFFNGMLLVAEDVENHSFFGTCSFTEQTFLSMRC